MHIQWCVLFWNGHVRVCLYISTPRRPDLQNHFIHPCGIKKGLSFFFRYPLALSLPRSPLCVLLSFLFIINPPVWVGDVTASPSLHRALSIALPFSPPVIVCVSVCLCVKGKGLSSCAPVTLPIHSEHATPFARDNYPPPPPPPLLPPPLSPPPPPLLSPLSFISPKCIFRKGK